MAQDTHAVPSDTLDAVLTRWSAETPERASVAGVISAVAAAGVSLSRIIARNPLVSGESAREDLGSGTNASGDDQKPLDVEAEALFVSALGKADVLAVCSEETEAPIAVHADGSLLVTLDPVDGSSNIDTLAPIGTVFGVLPADDTRDALTSLLQSGRHQLAAGAIVYGSSTVLALTWGDGTDVYALDPDLGQFRLVRAGIELPVDSTEYAINASNARHWGPGIRDYIDDLVSGELGPRERNFNMRWLASLVGEAYRILYRGGIFLYPADSRSGYSEGRIRLVYEANPVAFLCEQAGGAATDGSSAILDLTPTHQHQRVPLIFGSRSKVERVGRYLESPQESHNRSPLFSQRGLLRS
jgi:fructose-1,6-bisphosphatase I